jgi:hypothetical protein
MAHFHGARAASKDSRHIFNGRGQPSDRRVSHVEGTGDLA